MILKFGGSLSGAFFLAFAIGASRFVLRKVSKTVISEVSRQRLYIPMGSLKGPEILVFLLFFVGLEGFQKN